MMFQVRLKGLVNLLNKLAGVGSVFRSTSLWAEIASGLRAKMLVRTAAGTDADGRSFKPYSDEYALFRSKHGHPTGKVNLFWSGTMLSSIDYEAKPTGVRLYFSPTQAPPLPGRQDDGPRSSAKAYYLQTRTGFERQFFAFSKQDAEAIVRTIKRRVEENF